jgi:CrcB protein
MLDVTRFESGGTAPVGTLAPVEDVLVQERPRRIARPDPRIVAAVFAGGAAGALARAVLEELRPAGAGWPWVTLAANLAGTALLAWVAVRLAERLAPSPPTRALLGTGFCGGLTTFSTLQVEAVRLVDGGRPAMAAAYLAISVVGGLVVVFLAARLVRRARWRA